MSTLILFILLVLVIYRSVVLLRTPEMSVYNSVMSVVYALATAVLTLELIWRIK